MNDAVDAKEADRAHHVLVFCGSSASCDARYIEAATQLGTLLARAGKVVVYGGGAAGSMGALADAALAEGGEVIGIQPRFMRELEWSHGGLTALQIVDDMQERKRRMIASADAVVTLPGGSGSLEELFEAITSKRLGLYLNPIIILNQDGFYDALLAQLSHCVDESFMGEQHREMWQVVANPEAVLDAIENAPCWSKDALDFATL